MASQVEGDGGDRTIATNRRARHEYHILETVEAGLVLRGTEVKSLRAGGVNFKDSYATIRSGEGWLLGCHITPYSHGTDANHEPERDRKLLLHRRELGRLGGKIAERGLTLIPLRLYFKHGRAKVELGLGRGKKLHDKRATVRERDQRREMDQAARTMTRAGGPRRRSHDDEE
ncbi:MAG: SsrA-binding protein [Candidatus Rokuibacteriota bacterium]|nr:MAG: SsrA-binding protein [Candidatus Rokubacteria bacterium]